MARRFKTSVSKRTSYVYYAGGERIELIPGEAGVTEADIAILHGLDDAEIDADRRENYHVPVHYEGREELEQATQSNVYLRDAKADPLEELLRSLEELQHEEQLEKLRREVEGLSPQQQALLHQVFCEKKSNVAIAKEEGVTEGAIRKRLKTIYQKLRKKLG